MILKMKKQTKKSLETFKKKIKSLKEKKRYDGQNKIINFETICMFRSISWFYIK